MLIAATTVAAVLSIVQNQVIGTYFYWGVLALLFLSKLLAGRFWHCYLVLIAALCTLFVFQAGVIIGYRSWFYLTILVGVITLFKGHFSQLEKPGIVFWFFLLILGACHLLFAEEESGFLYSRGQILYIAVGLSAYFIASHASRYLHSIERLRNLTFLIFAGCTICLIVPLTLSENTRLGVGLKMDPNGLGITAIYAILFGLLYLSLSKGRNDYLLVVAGFVFIGLVLIQTGSRNAISTALCVLGLYFLSDLRIRKSAVNIVTILLVFAGLAVFAETSQLDYLDQRFNRAFGTEGRIDRLDHLVIAIAMAVDHPLGLGGGGFKENYREYSLLVGRSSVFTKVDPHNLFGMALADWGFPGLILLVAGFVGVGLSIRKDRGLLFRFKVIGLITFLILVNAGMNLSPIFMSLLALKMRDGEGPSAIGDLRRHVYSG